MGASFPKMISEAMSRSTAAQMLSVWVCRVARIAGSASSPQGCGRARCPKGVKHAVEVSGGEAGPTGVCAGAVLPGWTEDFATHACPA